MSRAAKSLDKFDELFDLADFSVTLPPPPLSTSSFLAATAVRVKLSDDPVDALPKHRGEWPGYLTEVLGKALTGLRQIFRPIYTTTINLIVLDRNCSRGRVL